MPAIGKIALRPSAFNINNLLRAEVVATLVRALRVLLIIIVFVLCVQIVRTLLDSRISSALTSSLANPSSTTTAPDEQPRAVARKDYSEIVKRNLFGPLEVKAPQAVATPRPATPLALELIGTFVSEGSAPTAIIENKKKNEQDVFNLQESIFGEAKLVAIYADRVEIERNGQIETLSLEEIPHAPSAAEGGVVSVGEDRFVVAGEELDKALSNMPLLLQQARAVPYFKDGKSVGLRLFALKPESLFTKIGLKNGDILKNINGSSLADLSQALKLFEDLKQERNFTLELERNQETREFKYDIR